MNSMKLVFGVLATVVLSACSDEPEMVEAPQPNPALKRELDALKDPTIKMARAVSSGKPGAAVDLKYEFAGKPEAGMPVEVKLALIPSAPAERMEIRITGMEGLTLAGELDKSIPGVKRGEAYEHTFSLMPSQNGMYYTSVTVITASAGSQMSRTFSIPLAVGATPVASQKATTPAQTDASGQPIQPMKAVESGT
jgi:hypothetical protein